jgi:hypothetical protein
MLVSENSKLWVHMSFMPIRYRQEIESMQKSDNQLYREQRRIPKNISPQDTDNHAGKLKLIEAPRAHEMTRRYMHDCEYAGVNEIRAGLREAMRLKKNLYGHVIPFFQNRDHRRTVASTQERSNTKARQWKGQSCSNGKPVQRGPGTLH